MNIDLLKNTALLLVDVQNDFLEEGALPILGSFKILDVINQLLLMPFAKVVASFDWHPKDHISFAATHGLKTGSIIRTKEDIQHLWPVHCVQDSWGSMLSEEIDYRMIDYSIYKGSEKNFDSYSAFYIASKKQISPLEQYLIEHSIDHLVVTGLALDVCVLHTALDALSLGFEVTIIQDACKAVGGKDAAKDTYHQLEEKGASIYTYDAFNKYLKSSQIR